MESLPTIIEEFIFILHQSNIKVPHKKVVQVLEKLLEMATIFKDECSSIEVTVLQDLLRNLLKLESKFSGKSGVEFLVSMMKAIDLLFKHLKTQINLIRKLQEERLLFGIKTNELHNIVDGLSQVNDTEKEEVKVADANVQDFEAVRSSTNYITHYKARHSDFSSQVIVVLWRSGIPGPSICHDGMPVLYVHHIDPPGDFSSWGEFPSLGEFKKKDTIPPQSGSSSSKLQEVFKVKEVIARHQNSLFANHSNLTAIHTAEDSNGNCCIEFVVLAKHFKPIADRKPLPRVIEGIPTKVCSGWVELCGRQEQQFHRPLLPGAGFAAGPDAFLNLNVSEEEYVPPVLGTLGGWYVKDGQTYGVTCAHCIRKDATSLELHPKNTEVFQPSAMGKIVHASMDYQLSDYDCLKEQKGHHYAMNWLIRDIQENNNSFTPDLPPDSQCGTVFGAVLGQLNDNGPVVDVALVQLNAPIQQHCIQSITFPNSPPLQLGDQATEILDVENFPGTAFKVFGRGARSTNTMKCTVDPEDSDIYFRAVTPAGIGNLVFYCVHGKAPFNWIAGDSGTWCWTEDGKLVGMGMAFAHIDNVHCCCILPMSCVVAAIDHIMNST
jgi:hypothetical protein